MANDQNFDTVICEHIQQPQDRIIQLEHGSVHYLNSGDWVENCTALEYNDGQWTLYKYPDNITNLVHNEIVQEDDEDNFNNLSVFNLTSLYEIQRVSKLL